MRLASLAAAALLASTSLHATAEPRTTWDFVVRLDGRPIGTHRFALDRDGQGVSALSSTASFEVKLLGWTAYRYDHRNRERWSGNCLAAIDASTDDDGKRTRVQGERGGAGFTVRINGAPEAEPLPACVMSFAYWNQALSTQRQLLDPGTGRLVPVDITPLPRTSIETDRGAVEATGWRIAGLPFPIDVWWSAGDWVGLDTTVQGGRRLTYRLR